LSTFFAIKVDKSELVLITLRWRGACKAGWSIYCTTQAT